VKTRSADATDYVDAFLAEWESQDAPFRDLRANAGIYRVLRLAGLLQQELEKLARRHALSAGQFQALAALRRRHPAALTASEIGAAALLTSGTITTVVDRLVAAKLVIRAPNPRDGRGILVSLTSKGRRLIDLALAERNERLATLLDGLSAAEKGALATTMKKLLLAIGDEVPQ
jgi:DNA-binding MarR family transcriptional regulator